VAVFPSFTSGLGGFFTVIGKVATAVLAAFTAGFGGPLWIVLEVPSTVLAAFAARFVNACLAFFILSAHCRLPHGYKGYAAFISEVAFGAR
jgi:hypothetical protein